MSAGYEVFKGKQNHLERLIARGITATDELSMNQFSEALEQLKTKVNKDSFKIQVVGTFKNGKSTFINSFLGEEVLPAYALPCTAVIYEVKYGPEKKAVLYFKNPLPEVLPQELSGKAVAHMKKNGMKDVPPMEIPYDEIEDYVVIPIGKEPKDMLLESPYERIELFWPLELLKNGVEIIDSPGLNEHATRTKVTMEYLSKADAIIFVLNATSLCSMEEMNFIENNLQAQGFCELFFVINRFDIIPEREKPSIMQYARVKLKEFTSFGEEGMFFVSARDSLDAKMAGDREGLLKSGMIPFENYLSEFLTEKKGKLKLSQPARELKRILKEEAIGKILPRQRTMLLSSLDEVKERHEKIKPRLLELQEKKQQMYDKMMVKIEQCGTELKRAVSSNFMEITDLVPIWVAECTPKTKLGLIPNKIKLKAVIDEISEYASDKLEKHQIKWKNDKLIPLVQEKAGDVFASVEEELANILKEINEVGDEASGTNKKNQIAEATLGNIGQGGELAFGYASIYGFKEMGLQGAKYGGTMLLAMLAFSNPIVMLGVIGGAFFSMKNSNESKALKAVKDMFIEQMTSSISESSEETISELVNGILDNFKEGAENIASSLDGEINEVSNQIEAIIEEMEKGQRNIDEKQEELSETEEMIKGIISDTDTFLFKVVG